LFEQQREANSWENDQINEYVDKEHGNGRLFVDNIGYNCICVFSKFWKENQNLLQLFLIKSDALPVNTMEGS
jgi:hypothetical protein